MPWINGNTRGCAWVALIFWSIFANLSSCIDMEILALRAAAAAPPLLVLAGSFSRCLVAAKNTGRG